MDPRSERGAAGAEHPDHETGWSETRTVPRTRTSEATEGILRGRRAFRSDEAKTIIGGS
ncbi:MAG TPA: hypothetical protein VGC37_03520 [Friedmanniella sp.]